MSGRSEEWLKISQAVAGIDAELGRTLQARHGLGLSDYRALALLSGAPDRELRMQDLAQRLRLNQSSVSRMVERLERDGLTVRDLCEDDKRGVYTVLTDTGAARLAAARPDYEATLETALAEQGGAALLAALRR